jgi:uncharacterized protein
MNNLEDKVIVITGASQGLGKLLSSEMAKLGGRVAMVSRTKKLLEKNKEEITKNKGKAEVFVCDVTDYKQVKITVNEIIKKFGRIDILINGAGIWTTDEFEELNPELIEKSFKVNSIGPIYFTKSVLPLMKENNNGHILNVISKAGLDIDENGDWPTYTATKWALTGYTKALKYNLKDTKIKVSALYPGGFESNIFETAGEEEAHNQPWMMKTKQVVEAILYILNQPEELFIASVELSKKI